MYRGRVFEGSALENIVIPPRLKILDESTFTRCNNLKSISFSEDSKLEKIGAKCFAGSGLYEFIMP